MDGIGPPENIHIDVLMHPRGGANLPNKLIALFSGQLKLGENENQSELDDSQFTRQPDSQR